MATRKGSSPSKAQGGMAPPAARKFWLVPFKGGIKITTALTKGDDLGFIQQDGDHWIVNRIDLMGDRYATAVEAARGLLDVLEAEGKLPIDPEVEDQTRLAQWRSSVDQSAPTPISYPPTEAVDNQANYVDPGFAQSEALAAQAEERAEPAAV